MHHAYQKEKREWENAIYYKVKEAGKSPLKLSKATVEIKYYFKDKRRRDPDNYSGKFILDGLVKTGVIKDDSFSVIDLKLSADVSKDNPRTEITIMEKIDK